MRLKRPESVTCHLPATEVVFVANPLAVCMTLVESHAVVEWDAVDAAGGDTVFHGARDGIDAAIGIQVAELAGLRECRRAAIERSADSELITGEVGVRANGQLASRAVIVLRYTGPVQQAAALLARFISLQPARRIARTETAFAAVES